MGEILPILALCSSLLCPKEANADININIFPKENIERTIMADPDVYKTEIKVPFGLEADLLTKPIEKILPYISFSETLSLLSIDITSDKILDIMPKTTVRNPPSKKLSDKILSASLTAGGLVTFRENFSEYGMKLELFLNSPMIDDCLSDGNRFYLVGGVTGKGTDLRKFTGKNLSQIAESFIEDYSFSADVYIVPKSEWSDQYLILRAGIDNFSIDDFSKLNVNFSTAIEFPSLLYGLKIFKNFKISPYLSFNVKIPADSEKKLTASGQLGIKAGGESKTGLFLYAQADYTEENPLIFSTGIKINF